MRIASAILVPAVSEGYANPRDATAGSPCGRYCASAVRTHLAAERFKKDLKTVGICFKLS